MHITEISELPNFYIIGAAKSGTTALFDILAQHPQVFVPFVKEPTFFNNDANYSKGLEWYKKTYFKNANKFPARGEATPHYLYWGEKVASRFQQIYKQNEVKFIVIFRDPIKRAYSQYWMDIHRGIESLSFKDALKAEEQRLLDKHKDLEQNGLLKYGYFKGGCYATLLEPYLQRFPREQFHFLLQDDLHRNFSKAMEQLTDFLGIQKNFAFYPVESNLAYIPRNLKLHNFLLYKAGPYKKVYRKLIHFLPESSRYRIRTKLIQINRRQQSNPTMDPDDEKNLRNRFIVEIKRLETIMNRDLSEWLKEVK